MKPPVPRLYRGFRDLFPAELAVRDEMIERIRRVYERYGYAPLETPTVEYVDVLGKFLPESEQPEGGIYAFRNEDGEWVALRYDLTAPLSRVCAQYPDLPRPFRRYQLGLVFRLEKPGQDRFREFYQFDFDIVGTASTAADTEVCCIMCDVLEAVGIRRGKYIIRVNDRKVLSGVLETLGLFGDEKNVEASDSQSATIWLNVLRSIDKLDKIGWTGVRDLLTSGRRDPSSDFTPGLNLESRMVERIEQYINARAKNRRVVCDKLASVVGDSKIGNEGVAELRAIDAQLDALGYDERRIVFDPTVVRGLSYYTGPVFEGELTFPIVDEAGNEKSFGSIFGGGRYDDLIERFTGERVPATGASIGVDRLLAALKLLGRVPKKHSTTQILVTVMDESRLADYQLIAQELRRAKIKTELYAGSARIGQQLKYADTLDIPLALIAGDDELASGIVQVKDLRLGRELSESIRERDVWKKERPAQIAVPRAEMVRTIRELLRKYR